MQTLLFPVVIALLLQACPGLAQDNPDATIAPAPVPRFIRGQASEPTAESASDTAAIMGARSSRLVRVEMDEGTRTLIITTDPATNLQIQEIIRAIDKPVPQALIKVLFVEVTHSDDFQFGVDARYDHANARGTRAIVNSLFGFGTRTDGGLVSILQNDLDLTMRALAEVGQLNVLSRPSILARNKQEATITIGQKVPFIRNSRITEAGQVINTVEYEDVGIILTVTPHIGADGLIELDVAPEISTMLAKTVRISDTVEAPLFAKRSARTHVVVPSGKTVVIGGLMEDQQAVNVRKVPLLGDIPLLGALFRFKSTSKQKTELLIFLTPTIVADRDQLLIASDNEKHQAMLFDQHHDKQLLQQYIAPMQANAPTNEDN